MGGAAAEVSDATTEILLESAYFEASGIAKTSKRLGLRSEASARFERGVDPNDAGSRRGASDGAARARSRARSPVAGAIDVYPQPIERARITVRTERVNQLLGTALADAEIAACSRRSASRSRRGTATVPTLPPRPRARDRPRRGGRAPGRARPHRAHGPVEPGEDRRAQRRASATAAPSPTCSSAPATTRCTRCRCSRPPTSRDAGVGTDERDRGREPAARRGVDPAARAAARAAARGRVQRRARQRRRRAVRDRAPCSRRPPTATTLARRAAAPRRSPRSRHVVRTPHEPDRAVDVYDATAVVDALAARSCASPTGGSRPRRSPGFHPGTRGARSWSTARRSAPSARSRAEVVDALALPGAGRGVRDRRRRAARGARAPTACRDPVSRFPASTIDLAFVVDDDVPAGAILRRRSARPVATCSSRARLFDVFRSDALGAGQGQPGVRAAVPRPDRTLTDAEVGELRAKCIDAVVSDSRRRAARQEHERGARSPIAFASATPRSTARAWCSTRTG